jgi:hypothetical protein
LLLELFPSYRIQCIWRLLAWDIDIINFNKPYFNQYPLKARKSIDVTLNMPAMHLLMDSNLA